MPILESMQDDSLLCDISFRNLSSSTRSCSDSDCSYDLCRKKMPKKSQLNKQPQMATTATKKKPTVRSSDSINAIWTSTDSRNNTLQPNDSCPKYFSDDCSDSTYYRIPSAMPGHKFSLQVHQIPKQLFEDPRMTLDLESFVRVLRGGNNEIDTNTMDITLDPFASEYVWRNINSPDFQRYVELQYLANQLGSHMNYINEKVQMTEDDMKFIKNITGFNYREFRVNRAKDQTVDMQQLRDTDPNLILINRAIYSKPSPLSLDLHKAAEEFALNANCFEKLDEPRKMKQSPSKQINSQAGAFFEPKQSSTPIKTSIVPAGTWRNGPLEQPVVPPLYSRILQRNAANITNTSSSNNPGNASVISVQRNDTNDRMLYPQTMLLTSPAVPTVFPDMTNPSSMMPSRAAFKYATPNNFFDRVHASSR